MILEGPAPPTPKRSGIRFDYSYAVSLPGVLNIAQMIASIVSFAFALEFMSGNWKEYNRSACLQACHRSGLFEPSGCNGCEAWFQTMSMVFFCLTSSILACRIMHLEEVFGFPSLKMEMIIGIISIVGYMTIFGRAVAVVPFGIRNTLLSHGITISTFLAIIFYGWGTLLVYTRLIKLSARPRH